MKKREERSPVKAIRRMDGITWLLGIGCIICICLICVTLVSMDNFEYSTRSESFHYAQSMGSDRVMPGNVGNDDVYVNQEDVIPIVEEEIYTYYVIPVSANVLDKESKANDESAASSTGSEAVGNVKESAPVSTLAYDDRIEREAREVINGDFGNNPGRRVSLGGDYAAVQQRVNEILGR